MIKTSFSKGMRGAHTFTKMCSVDTSEDKTHIYLNTSLRWDNKDIEFNQLCLTKDEAKSMMKVLKMFIYGTK